MCRFILDVNDRVRHHHGADRARHGRGDGHPTAWWCWTTAKKIGDGSPGRYATTKT